MDISSSSAKSHRTSHSGQTSDSDFSVSSETSGSEQFSDVEENGAILNEEDERVVVYYDEDRQSEIQQLREWALEHKIFLSYIDELLAILRVRLLTDLPKCAKTFLGTAGASYNIVPMLDKKG